MTRFVGFSVLGFFLMTAPLFAAELKVGYVDLQKALSLSQAGQAAMSKLSEQASEYKKTIEEKEEELKLLREEMDKKTLLLSDDARSEKERNYQQKLKDLQRFAKDIDEEIQQKEADYVGRILEELSGVISEVGKKDGIQLILPANNIVYADPSIDLTDRILEEYDKKVKSEESK